MSAFASGKFALRATGQSLAREFGPKGVHIAHAIIDGVIDIPRTKDWPVNGGVEDGKISADAVSSSTPPEQSCCSAITLTLLRLPIRIGTCTRSLNHISLKNWMLGLMWRSSSRLYLNCNL